VKIKKRKRLDNGFSLHYLNPFCLAEECALYSEEHSIDASQNLLSSLNHCFVWVTW